VGDIRRYEKRIPCWIRDRVRVVIGSASSDRCNRTPEIVKVLGLESGDEAIGHGEVEQGEEPRALPQIEALLRQDVSGYAIPTERRAFVPESGDLALIGRAHCTVDIADAFLFIVIGRVLSAGQVEVPGPSRAELLATGERERSDLSPTRQSRGQEGRRRRLPDSRSGSWCVRHRRIRSVRAAQGQNRRGCGLSNRHASGLCGAI